MVVRMSEQHRACGVERGAGRGAGRGTGRGVAWRAARSGAREKGVFKGRAAESQGLFVDSECV